jgi:pilus assembly protein FimV
MEGEGMTVMKRLMRHWVAQFWVSALLTAPVWGVGLGELTVHTYLNEPLRAEVLLLDVESIEISDLRVELASEQEFQRVAAERVYWLTQLRFEVQAEGLEKRVLLTTDAPLREPYLDFVMAVRWPQGRLLRDYTALIDLPPSTIRGDDSVTQSLSDNARPISNETPQPDPIPPRSAETLPQLVPSPTELAGASSPTAGSSYVVVQNDTLWRIASNVAPDRLSVEQVMLEIIRMNPQAFQQQNVNGLKAGYRLELPLTDAIGVDRATAIDAVALQNNAWQFRDEPEQGALTPVAAEVIDAAVPNSGLPVGEAAPPVPTPASVLEPMSMADEASATLPDEDNTLWVDQALVAPTQLETTQLEPAVLDLAGESAAMGASRADFEALTMTVGRLQSTLAELQEQITQRDTELASLKALLALRDERLQAAVTALAKRNDASLRDRLVSAAISPAGIWVVLFSLVLCLSWFYRRQQSVPAVESAESAADQVDRAKATAGTDATAEIDGSGARPEQMPDVAQGLSAERVSDGRRPAGLHSTEATQATGNNDSELVADERSSTVVGASSAERSQVAEGASEPLTRDDLSLAPKDSLSPEHHGDDSIYGLETDPMDSQLDLARAYLDMGDDESARPVLTLVIEQGSLTQQAEARALLNRLDVS